MRDWIQPVISGFFWAVVVIIIVLLSTSGQVPFIYNQF